MIKNIFLVISIPLLLFGIQKQNIKEQLHIKALKLENNATVTVASGGVFAYSPSYYITADKIIYYKDKSLLKLIGNVNLVKNCTIQTISNEALLYLNNNNMDISPFFMKVQTNQIWINSTNAKLKDNIYYLKKSVVSSCRSDDPEWWFEFSSAKFDSKKEWIDTYNTRIFVQGIPVLYLPYFGFPTNKKRKSGLLAPTIGYSKYEGFEYSQPIYYAPALNYDFEFVPQIRTSRGNGIYTYYRWADSINSILHIKTGFFKDTNKFKKTYEMESTKHYGATLVYNKNNLFTKTNNIAQDGLYLNLIYLNDVDYLNLEHHVNLNFTDWLQDESSDNINYNPTEDYGKKIESIANYHYVNNSDYYGIYARYYIDTSVDNNDKTMQLLPEIQYHKFSQSLIKNNIFYSVDFNYKNHYRKVGLSVDEYQMFIPLTISFPLIKNYLFIDLKEKLTTSIYKYKEDTNLNQNFKNALYIQETKEISLSSELLKSYSSTIHTLGIKASINIPNKIKQYGDIYKISNNSEELKDFGISQTTKNITLSLNQYLYNKTNMSNLFSHSIKQPFIYNKEHNSWEKSELENDFILNLKFKKLKVKLANRTLYNHYDKKIVTSSSTININSETHYAILTHYLSNQTPHSTYTNNDTRSIEIGTKFKRYYTFSARINYDFYNKLVSKSYLKLSMKKNCWKYSWKLENDLVSAPTIDHSAQRQHIIYFTIELKSIGAFEYKYLLKKDDS